MTTSHTADEIKEAIDAADMLYKRDGYLSSQTLLKELETRTGKPASYWHVIELFNAIKAARAGKPYQAKKYQLTAEHKRMIIEAAEQIAYSQPIPKLSAKDILKYFYDLKEKPANTSAIVRAPAAEINAILKAAGWTQYNTGGYITSLPPARNADEMQIRAVRILEAAEDPQSGIAEKLHDIRFRHKYRDATPEELQAAVLNGFLADDIYTDAQKFNKAANTATERKTKKRARKFKPKFEPTTKEASHAYTAAINDLEKARAAAGKKPGAIEEAIYLIHKPAETKTASNTENSTKTNTETNGGTATSEPPAGPTNED